MEYDPQKAPDPGQWLDLSEDAQIRIVREYHHSGAPGLLKEELHAALHVMIENQLALKEKPVRDTMDRLGRDGLDRHDSIHAIGTVLMEHMYDTVHRGSHGANTKEMYYQDLAHLSASEWSEKGHPPEGGKDSNC